MRSIDILSRCRGRCYRIYWPAGFQIKFGMTNDCVAAMH